MKLKSMLVVAAVVTLAACGSPYRATDATVVVAPSSTQTVFTTQYPYARNVVWMRYDAEMVPIDWELAGWPTLDANAYLVRFNQDNDYYYAWYDDNGNWIGTTYAVTDYSLLPMSVNSTISTKYPGYTITSVNRELRGDRVAFEVELKNSDTKMKVLLDANGNVIKSKTRSLY